MKKIIRRGNDFYDVANERIGELQRLLYTALPRLLKEMNVVSFDNLALKQLEVKDVLFKDKDNWDEFYMGNDGEYTFYIDAVNKTYSRSSTEKKIARYPIKSSVIEMFNTFK